MHLYDVYITYYIPTNMYGVYIINVYIPNNLSALYVNMYVGISYLQQLRRKKKKIRVLLPWGELKFAAVAEWCSWPPY